MLAEDEAENKPEPLKKKSKATLSGSEREINFKVDKVDKCLFCNKDFESNLDYQAHLLAKHIKDCRVSLDREDLSEKIIKKNKPMTAETPRNNVLRRSTRSHTYLK